MQKTCLRLYYNRKTGGDIAQALGISKSTVESHLAQARRTLGVTRSIEAAELLHAFEAETDPCDLPTHPAPLPMAIAPAPPPIPPDAQPWWRAAIPVRSGNAGNGLTISQRLGWIFGVAVAVALAVGALANALRFINELTIHH
jgi:DNA-binding CsgD family transcriptional regulator